MELKSTTLTACHVKESDLPGAARADGGRGWGGGGGGGQHSLPISLTAAAHSRYRFHGFAPTLIALMAESVIFHLLLLFRVNPETTARGPAA